MSKSEMFFIVRYSSAWCELLTANIHSFNVTVLLCRAWIIIKSIVKNRHYRKTAIRLFLYITLWNLFWKETRPYSGWYFSNFSKNWKLYEYARVSAAPSNLNIFEKYKKRRKGEGHTFYQLKYPSPIVTWRLRCVDVRGWQVWIDTTPNYWIMQFIQHNNFEYMSNTWH